MIETQINLIIEKIKGIVSSQSYEKGTIKLDTVEINGEYFKRLNIDASIKYLNEGCNLDIAINDEPSFFKDLLDTLISEFADSDCVAISKCNKVIPSEPIQYYYQMEIWDVNTNNHVNLHLIVSNPLSPNVIKEYNANIVKLEENQQQSTQSK